jgi:hypothetical protein
VDPADLTPVAFFAAGGVAAGLWLLACGLAGYRTAIRVSDTSTSPIASMAAGEVRISGVVEAAEILLVSPLQSAPCVYYHSTIEDPEDTSERNADFAEERAVGFGVRDASGVVRVFPRGASWDVERTLDESSGSGGGVPPGVRLRTGEAITMAEPDRETAIAALLTAQPATPRTPRLAGDDRGRDRRFREARLAPGDRVTIIGRALPFGDLSDPTEADITFGGDLAIDDPEVAADMAAARAAGRLAEDPADAWGNAAIPGFGIGRPVRDPELDPAATRLALASAEEQARASERFEIAPETLVLAGAGGSPLLVASGMPGEVIGRQEDRFLVGLLGVVLAIASAMVLAVAVAGGLLR